MAHRGQIGKLKGHCDEGRLAPLWSCLAGQVAVEVMRLLIGFIPPTTIGRFYEFDAVSPVATAARCTACAWLRELWAAADFAQAWDQDFLPMNFAT